MFIDLSDLNNTGYSDLLSMIEGTINLTLSLAALLAVIFLVYTGYLYIFSKGEGEKAEKAQRSLIYSLIGLVICFIAPLVIKFILVNVLNQTV